MLQKSGNRQTQSVPSIFLCAPINFPEKDNLNELPGTASEVKEIDALFESKQLKKALYLNSNANEELVKSGGLDKFALLHFATHGIVDEKNPELSRIFLQTDSKSEDGNLFAGEIYNLKLNANLVTLSACQTGLGKISKGEGVIGLSRALIYAGAKNVMVSFWSVADESTALLMKSFYQNLLNDSTFDFSKNLRQAKLGLMENDKYTAPYYWAPFILIGF
jgi:CHAT domain-containing protein